MKLKIKFNWCSYYFVRIDKRKLLNCESFKIRFVVRDDIVEIGKEDLARKEIIEKDDRYYADWTGVREYETTNFGYKNLCLREIKLTSTWNTLKEDRRRTDYTLPFNQTQTYCNRQWMFVTIILWQQKNSSWSESLKNQ